jgi:hypothetical protein
MSDTLASGATLSSGQSLTSGHYQLKMQSNGILRLTDTSNGNVLWSKGILNHTLATTKMQTNGDLQILFNGNVDWDSQTNHIGSRLVLQSNGNLVILDTTNTVVWESGTGQGAAAAE